ncbi:N-6 DNA methylase [Stutzerimonas stutzeri]|uniref:N-6 DNA methylase n=1 Tax=Stutzerimonas stutzeri TaxID=316 RepID=UPI0015E36E80|nr:N-6 DNA methylase [Stutzerimonas stutzeri]MBA1280212.1 N-6 DNA methylase [Stutzerimonas stutzeri]
MATKVWLDLTMYGIRLFVNLDQVNKTNHTLVVAGPRIEGHRETLKGLGFSRDTRFTTEYWVRPLVGMTPRMIHEVFPHSFMREMALEVVMPALAAKTKLAKTKRNLKEKANVTELTDARSLPVNADRGELAPRVEEPSILGSDNARNHASSEPGDADHIGTGGQAGGIPEEPAGQSDGRGTQAGEGVEASQPAEPTSVLPGAGKLAEPQQAGSEGTSDRGADEKLERSGSGVGELTNGDDPLVELAGHIQARVTAERGLWELADAPADWLLMNAARPLVGSKTSSNGPFLAGRYYAAIDPTDDRAASYVETNRSLDAHVVVHLTKDDQIDLILWQDEYEHSYREQFSGDELYDVLRGRVGELNALSFGELQTRRAEMRGTASISQTDQARSEANSGVGEIALEQMVLIAADSIEQLRGQDVYRVLDQAESQQWLQAIAQYITSNRADLAQEVSESLEDVANERGYASLASQQPRLSTDAPRDFRVEVQQLFSSGSQQDAFKLFQKDPSANKLTFDEFVEAMHASAGGPEAALRLSPTQRFILSKAGATSRAVELFATVADLNSIFTTESLAAQELASVIVEREQLISNGLVNSGWVIGEAKAEVAGERSVFWNKGQHQIFRLLTEKGWQYSGHVDGAVLPAFTVTDNFNESLDQILESIWQESKAHFGVELSNAPSQDQPVSFASEDDEPIGIDRIWRGATYEDVLAGQRSDAYRLDAFTALEKAETNGLGQDDWKQRQALASFKGWGGIANEVRTDARVKSKNRIGNLIAERLGMDSSAFNSLMLANRLESYYTPAPLSRSVWLLLEQAGVRPDGRFLEAGCGTGIFYATAPADVHRHGRLIGIESDPIAARIAKVMVPDVTLVEQRYERAVLDRNFDVVIGNVPFGETIITDDRYPRATHIHDYFIVRSLDHLKPGGMMAVITSSGTMDKKDATVREQIMDKANLVAAIRLPVEAFDDQGARVTTDILFLQRRPDGTAPDYDFSQTSSMPLEDAGEQHTFQINQYFLDNPDNVLGEFNVESSAFGPKMTVRASSSTKSQRGYAILEQLATEVVIRGKAIVPEGIANRTEWPLLSAQTTPYSNQRDDEALPDSAMMMDVHTGFVGDVVLFEDKLVEVVDIVDQFDEDGVRTGRKYLAIAVEVGQREQDLLRAYIGLRDAARALIEAQLQGTDAELSEAQAAAQDAYESFVDRFGPVNALSNVKVFGDDPGSAEVCALEIWDDETSSVLELADAFTQRVVNPELEASANNAEDAYFVSIDRKGIPDLEYMEQASGISKEKLLEELLGVRVFFDPSTGALVRADHYLSGNVHRKLEEARQAALLNDQYLRNVDALVAVQPTRVPFQDITISLGANWIPADDIRRYVGSLLGANLTESDFKARYSMDGAFWSIDVSSAFKRDYETQRRTLYGTERANLEVLLEKLLNKQKPTHTYKEDGKTKTDEQATLASRAKQDELNELFYRWVASDPERAERYADLYNQSTNVIKLPEIDGSRLSFPGLAPTWHPRDHQKNMVAMSMLGYNVMAAHAVGGGKTFEMVAIAMKLKQIGMVNKPMIAVPNHMLGQISREAKQMYPGARILMVTADDLRGSKRKRFLALARNNDWDIVVCTHSMLNGISAPLDIVVREYEQQISVLNSKLAEADNSRLERQLSAKIKSVESELAAAREQYLADEEKGNILTLDKLGVDSIQVDEAHLYKNLDLSSAMNVLGVTTAGSKRSFNMWALGQYLERLHGKPFGLNFFTGTPIANSMCELYVHNKMLRNDLLKEIGIHHFDEWASRFGDVVSNLEALPEGGGFRVNERFARFVNCPEMLKLFRSFADVKTKEQMNLPRPKVHTNVVAVEQSDWQQAFMKHLAIRAVAVRRGKVDPSEDNMLSIASAGRKAALDMRLVEPILPEESSVKLVTVAGNIHRLWEQHADVKASQLVFIDLGTPGKDKEFSTYTELKERLVELGVPAQDIAFIHDAKNNDAKEELFAKVRSGEKRVLIGSTEKMGVGTNVQERMCALHHVDCPWRPADIEQRDGRIDRQGNLYFTEVEVYRYTTKDSFDLFMWETNKRKATFISQALSDPDIAGRDVSEEMDVGYAEVMAVTTGNPRIREKVEVDDKVVKLERKDKAWYGDRASKLSAEYYLKQDIKAIQSRIDLEQTVGELLPRARWKCVEVTGAINGIQDGDTTWLYATDLGNALLSRVATVEARMMLNNRSEAPLSARVGEIDLMLELKQVGEQRGMWFIYGQSAIDGTRLGVNVVQQTKNTQMLGRGVRCWFDSSKRLQDFHNDMIIKIRGLSALGDLEALREAQSPYQAQLAVLKDEKRELDAWFAAQDFDKLGDGPDPFLTMLSEHRMQNASHLEDELEEVELMASSIAPSQQDNLFDLGETDEIKPQQHVARVSGAMSM